MSVKSLDVLENEFLEARNNLTECRKELSAVKKIISDAREELSSSDYKRLKNVEYVAVGLPAPYPWEQLHTESQALRDIVNENEPIVVSLTERVAELVELYRTAYLAYTAKKNEVNAALNECKEEEAEKTENRKKWAFET